MNKIDITLVLYGFKYSTLSPTFADIHSSAEMINRVWVLLSGDNQEMIGLNSLIQQHRLGHMVEVEHRYDNLGFATGHNRLVQRAFEMSETAACLVLNPDIRFDAAAMREIVDAVDDYSDSLFGPILGRLDSSPTGQDEQVTLGPRDADSFGIGWTKTARHFDIGQGKPWDHRPKAATEVAGVTGACLVVPRAAHNRIVAASGHFFDDLFIAYREDAELGVRSSALGISSYTLPINGFNHVRSTRGFERTNDLVNLLGVRNRFLIKWALERLRPGSRILGTIRDAGVIIAVFIKERTSIPGLVEAFQIKRFARNRGKAWRATISQTKM